MVVHPEHLAGFDLRTGPPTIIKLADVRIHPLNESTVSLQLRENGFSSTVRIGNRCEVRVQSRKLRVQV